MMNTKAFIQRLIPIISTDPTESEQTAKQVEELTQRYVRDKYDRLPQRKRDQKRQNIDKAMQRQLNPLLYRKAHSIVEKALRAPLPPQQQPAVRRAPVLIEQALTTQKMQQDVRGKTLTSREKELQAREQDLQEEQEMLQAQVASLSQWESELAQRAALAQQAAPEALKPRGPLERHPTL